MLRYTRCNVVILVAAAAWLMSFSSCIVRRCGSYTVLIRCPHRKFSADTWKVRYTNQIRKRYRNWRTSATQLQPSKSLRYIRYTSTRLDVRSCIDAGGNHLQHLLWWCILSAFGYCINLCIYATLRIRATFSWPTLYFQSRRINLCVVANKHSLHKRFYVIYH